MIISPKKMKGANLVGFSSPTRDSAAEMEVDSPPSYLKSIRNLDEQTTNVSIFHHTWAKADIFPGWWYHLGLLALEKDDSYKKEESPAVWRIGENEGGKAEQVDETKIQLSKTCFKQSYQWNIRAICLHGSTMVRMKIIARG